MITNHWLSISHYSSQPLVQYNTPWLSTTGSAKHTIIHNHWLSITHHDSQPLVHHNSEWLTTTGSALHTMIHNHWSTITRHNSQPLAHIIHNQWLDMTHHNANKIRSVYHNMIPNCSVQYRTHDSQPLAQHSTPLVTTTGSALHTMIHNHLAR